VSDIEDTSDDVVDTVSKKGTSSSRSGGSGDRGDPVRDISDNTGASRLSIDSGGARPSGLGGIPSLLSDTSVEAPGIEVLAGLLKPDRWVQLEAGDGI